MIEHNPVSTLSPDARAALESLRHPDGTFRLYHDVLERLSNYVLFHADDIGMGAMETLNILRTLAMIDIDLHALSGRPLAPEAAGSATPVPDAVGDAGADDCPDGLEAGDDHDADSQCSSE